DEPGGVHLVQDGEVPLIFSSYIFSVITDNDYFLFSDTESKWRSYSLFSVELELQKQKLVEESKKAYFK
ncbi:TPA: hypothetical protein HA265_01960, partial [Candidatus Woesearchaeota archaeon]|nr:hypothetical protein [Candidatus Woesearchaeota archaeon]